MRKNSRNDTARITKSKLYNKLATRKTFEVRTTLSTAAGVKIETYGAKKGSTVEVLLPSTTHEGSNRTVKVQMTGRQARALYETLSRHFNA
jgi:hypothetical protein